MAVLAGKTAIVTGASRGIGAAAAMELAAAGAAVVLAARTGADAGRIAAAITAKGGRAVALACDVTDYASITAMVDEAHRQFEGIDVLVNNAGVIEPIGPIAHSDPVAWARNIEVNLLGAYHIIRAVLPRMLAIGAGTLINVSSGAAHRPLEGWGAYCAAKAGLAMLTAAVTLETGPSGIRVFGLSPGTVDTDMQAAIRASGINRVSRIPQADLTPASHPAKAIVYLCTEAAADLAGSEVSLSDPAFRQRIGLR